nr:Uma2 family endonuclease [Paenibacillus bovis]
MTKEGKKNGLLRKTGLTYDDYAAIDDGQYYELAGGKLELISPAPYVTHQMISYEIQKKLDYSCSSNYIILNSPVDLILSPSEVRQPDLVIIHRDRFDIISKRGIEGAPDLVVEILSPSSLKRDKIDKLKVYAEYQIPEYWIVDTENECLEQYTLQDNRYELINIFQEEETITSKHIPCISFTMKDIMDKIPELRD